LDEILADLVEHLQPALAVDGDGLGLRDRGQAQNQAQSRAQCEGRSQARRQAAGNDGADDPRRGHGPPYYPSPTSRRSRPVMVLPYAAYLGVSLRSTARRAGGFQFTS